MFAAAAAVGPPTAPKKAFPEPEKAALPLENRWRCLDYDVNGKDGEKALSLDHIAQGIAKRIRCDYWNCGVFMTLWRYLSHVLLT